MANRKIEIESWSIEEKVFAETMKKMLVVTNFPSSLKKKTQWFMTPFISIKGTVSWLIYRIVIVWLGNGYGRGLLSVGLVHRDGKNLINYGNPNFSP